MHSWRKALGYGVLVWLAPFLTTVLFYGVRQNDRILFESIFPVVVVAVTVVFAVLYIGPVPHRQALEGVFLGLLWLVLCIVLDQAYVHFGPMRMNFLDYAKDIGLTYVMIPFITTGHGLMQQRAKE